MANSDGQLGGEGKGDGGEGEGRERGRKGGRGGVGEGRELEMRRVEVWHADRALPSCMSSGSRLI